MVDIVVQGPTEAAFRAVWQDLQVPNHATTRGHGTRFNSGRGEWAFTYFGKVKDKSSPTGTENTPFGDTIPTYSDLPGVFAFVRWNGDEPEPPFWAVSTPRGLSAYWRSDQVDGNGDPVPLPEWFPRIA